MRLLNLALFGVLAFAACHSAPQPLATARGRSLAVRIAGMPGLDNFARVNDRLYRGAQPTAEGYQRLKELGVKTVINFRSSHDYSSETLAAGLDYIRLPIQADLFGSEPPSEDQVKTFFDIVLDPARQPVFIHCMGGKDRTGTLSALYRMEIEGWTTDDAIEEMQAFGFHDNYVDLMSFVRAYKPRGLNIKR
jgi:tyrosine-protein phosphatase SIW14